MRHEVIADLRAFIDHRVRIENGPPADLDFIAHHRERSDGCTVADARGFGNRGQGMNARFRLGRLIEEFERAREIEIRIAGNQAGYGQIAQRPGGQDRARARMFHLGGVLGIGEKRQFPGRCMFHPGHARDVDVSVSDQLTAERARDIPESHCQPTGYPS